MNRPVAIEIDGKPFLMSYADPKTGYANCVPGTNGAIMLSVKSELKPGVLDSATSVKIKLPDISLWDYLQYDDPMLFTLAVETD